MKNAVFWDVALCRSCANRFLRNVGSYKIYTAPHPRKQHSSDMESLAKLRIKQINFIEQYSYNRGRISHRPYACYMFQPLHPSRFSHLHNIKLMRIYIMEALIMSFSLSSSQFALRFKYFHSNLFLNILKPTSRNRGVNLFYT
jgi:hypothetical protein